VAIPRSFSSLYERTGSKRSRLFPTAIAKCRPLQRCTSDVPSLATKVGLLSFGRERPLDPQLRYHAAQSSSSTAFAGKPMTRRTPIAPRWTWLCQRLWGSTECGGWVVWTTEALSPSDNALIKSRISRGLLQLKGDRIHLTDAGHEELHRSSGHFIGA
jgi:hypothetical protein